VIEMENTLDNIREYMHIVDDGEIKRLLADIPVSALSAVWDELENEESLKLFFHLNLEQKVDLINDLSPIAQEELINRLSLEHIRNIFEEMEPDDLVDIIQAVSIEARESVWNSLSTEARQETQFLLRFDADDAAGLMTPRYVAIRSTINVGQALSFLRKGAGEVETVYYMYVVDPLKRLTGVVSIRDILSSQDDVIIDEIMVKKVIAVHEETDQEEVAKILEDNDLIALPVIDRYNRLLGIVTFDDVIDVIREEQTEDVYKMGAMGGSTDRYTDTNIWGLVKKRVPWLIVLLLAGTITTNVLNFYEPIYLSAVFLMWFVPVITQTGGNSGTQSSTLMIRGLATGELRFRDIGSVMLKEVFVGVIMGIILGAIITARTFILPPGVAIFEAVSIGLSLSLVVLFSTTIGALAPLLIHKMGFDPTVMAGPLMATVIDVIGLTLYFQMAKLLLGL
jgi:magnesium transporter